MQTISEAFLSAGDNAKLRPETYDTSAQKFEGGVEWVRNFLVPAVEQGNSELQQHHIAIRLDLNLDSRSTNHGMPISGLPRPEVRRDLNTRSTYSVGARSGYIRQAHPAEYLEPRTTGATISSATFSAVPPRSSALQCRGTKPDLGDFYRAGRKRSAFDGETRVHTLAPIGQQYRRFANPELAH
jgi:hypothetical protein